MSTTTTDDLQARPLEAVTTPHARRNPLTELFITISGANRAILEQAPREATKQAAMGAVLLSTALVAVVAAAYAFHVALHLWLPVAVVAGAIWGLIILNLDRWLVVSTPRLTTKFGNLVMALPRFGLALLIGTVISTPLTLAVFGAEINSQLKVMAAQEEDEFTQQLKADARFADLPAKKAEIADLQTALATGLPADAVQVDPRVAAVQEQLDARSADLAEAEAAVICEKEGTCGSGTPGAGIAFDEKIGRRDALRQEVTTLQQQLGATTAVVEADLSGNQAQLAVDQQAQLAALQEEVGAAERLRDAETAAHQEAVGNGGGLLARLEALSQIQQGHPELMAAHLLLFGLMTAIECLPIIFKTMVMLAPPSLYEQLSARDDESIAERTKQRLQTEYEEAEVLAREGLKAAEARGAAILDAEMRGVRLVLDAQLAVTEEEVRRWKHQQLDTAPQQGTDQPRLPRQTGAVEDSADARVG